MKITKANTLWPERLPFMVSSKDVGNQYIFLNFHTPVKIQTDEGIVCTKGDTFIIIGKHSELTYEVMEKTMIHNVMHIEGNLDAIMKQAGLKYNTVYNLRESTFITKITHDIELETTNYDKYSDGIIKGNIERLILLIGRAISSGNEIIDQEVRDTFILARSTIHRYYYKEWDILEMANLVHMSRSRFSELYTQIIGIPPKKDLQNVRIEHAKYMLTTTGHSIKDISKEIGYDSEYYFIRKFKEFTGKTPGEYRRSETKK